jgi:hypothetical protein
MTEPQTAKAIFEAAMLAEIEAWTQKTNEEIACAQRTPPWDPVRLRIAAAEPGRYLSAWWPANIASDGVNIMPRQRNASSTYQN